MFRGSSGFPFCLVRNLVQCLFTSLWIVLWWWLYAVASLTLCSLYLCLCCDGIFCEDLLFSCSESVVAEVNYCVCDVRLLSSLVCGFLAGLRLGEFLTN